MYSAIGIGFAEVCQLDQQPGWYKGYGWACACIAAVEAWGSERFVTCTVSTDRGATMETMATSTGYRAQRC
jgi:hypothetical protein